MSQATMTFQAKGPHSSNWRSMLITLFVFVLVGGSGWWAYQAGWLDRIWGQASQTATISQATSSQTQVQGVAQTSQSINAPTVAPTIIAKSIQANGTTKSTPTANTGNKVAATTPAVAPVSIPVLAGVHGTQVWDKNGKSLATLDSGVLLTANGRSADGAWLAVQTAAGAGWVQTDQVIAYDVQTLATIALPATVVATAQQAQMPASATASAATVVENTTVASTAPATATATTHLAATVSTTDGRLNVRSGPGTDYAVLAKANTGDELTVSGRNATSDWLQVQLSDAADNFGWVAAQYVKLNGDVNMLPVSIPVSTALAS